MKALRKNSTGKTQQRMLSLHIATCLMTASMRLILMRPKILRKKMISRVMLYIFIVVIVMENLLDTVSSCDENNMKRLRKEMFSLQATPFFG